MKTNRQDWIEKTELGRWQERGGLVSQLDSSHQTENIIIQD